MKMLAAVISAALATPSPASWVVPRCPMIAESANKNSGSATKARNAGTASRKISRRWFKGLSARKDPLPFTIEGWGVWHYVWSAVRC